MVANARVLLVVKPTFWLLAKNSKMEEKSLPATNTKLHSKKELPSTTKTNSNNSLETSPVTLIFNSQCASKASSTRYQKPKSLKKSKKWLETVRCGQKSTNPEVSTIWQATALQLTNFTNGSKTGMRSVLEATKSKCLSSTAKTGKTFPTSTHGLS